MGSIFQRTTNDVEQTRALAAILVTELEAGDVICLEGELGTGKTSFVTGLMEALGGDPKEVSSPTFALENRYPLPEKAPAKELVHADLYRVKGKGKTKGKSKGEEELAASLQEAREEGAIVVVEWGRSLRERLSPCWEVVFSWEDGDKTSDSRRLLVARHGDGRGMGLLDRLEEMM